MEVKEVKKQLKDRIAECSQVMVTTEFPHLYCKAIGTRKVEQIIDEVLASSEQETEEKEI